MEEVRDLLSNHAAACSGVQIVETQGSDGGEQVKSYAW